MTFWENARRKAGAVLKAALGLLLFVCVDYSVYSVFVVFKIDYDVYRGTVTTVINIVTFSVMFLVHFFSSTKKDPLIKLKKISPDQACSLVIIALGMLGFVTMYIILADKIAQYLESMKEAMVDYRESVDRYSETPQIVVPVWDSVLYALAICFFVPVSEEMCFRGVVFGQLRRAFGPVSAVLISAVGFGFMHGISVHIGYAMICGIIIASCYYLTDSIAAPVILHMVFNIFGSGIANFMDIEYFGIPENISIPVLSGINTASLLFMPLAVIAFAFLINIKRNNDREDALKTENMSIQAGADPAGDDETEPETLPDMPVNSEIGVQK